MSAVEILEMFWASIPAAIFGGIILGTIVALLKRV